MSNKETKSGTRKTDTPDDEVERKHVRRRVWDRRQGGTDPFPYMDNRRFKGERRHKNR